MSRFNPHHPDAAEVFDAADKFKQRCLLDQSSLFLDGQTLWTADHFQALIDNYVKQPDVGDGGFYDKLASQLATHCVKVWSRDRVEKASLASMELRQARRWLSEARRSRRRRGIRSSSWS